MTSSRLQPTRPCTPAAPTRARLRDRASRLVALGLVVAGLVTAAACSASTSVSSGPGSTAASTAPTSTGAGGPGTPGSIVELPGSTPGSAPDSTRPPGTTPPGSLPRTTTTFVPSAPPVAATTEDGAIYLALIRTSIDRTTRAPSGKAPYAEIVIVDHGVADAGAGTSTGSTSTDGPPFSAGVRADLTNGLADLGPVRFATSAKAGAVSSTPGNEHVLVIAGPIEKVGSDGSTVHVGLSKTCGPMCGSGGTDILERRNGQWVVTGATGAGWIS